MDWFYELWRELGEVIRGWIEAVVPESAEGWVTYLVLGLLSILVLVNIPMVLVPILIFLERRLLGRFQNRGRAQPSRAIRRSPAHSRRHKDHDQGGHHPHGG